MKTETFFLARSPNEFYGYANLRDHPDLKLNRKYLEKWWKIYRP